MAGTLVLSMLVKCNTAGHMPDEQDAQRILGWALPKIDVFAQGGEDVDLDDENAKLDRSSCFTPRGETIQARRYPEPNFECVFWLTGSNGQSYAMALLVKYIPKSSVTVTESGRRLDWADVGRYDIQPLSHMHQRKIIRRHAAEYYRP